MTSRVTPKQCSLREALRDQEVCPGPTCLFWEAGGAVVEPRCAIERLGVPVQERRDLARHLLDLRLRADEVRTAAERGDAHRRLSELLNLNRE
jgi:hypothetical protein